MSESHLQHVLADSHASTSSRLDTLVASKLYSCHPIWDSENATFSECALPYFSAIPVSIAALLGLGYILAPLLAPWRPEWTKSFVVEFPSELPELPKPKRNGFSEWTLTLVTLSIAASAALMVELIPNPSNLSVMLLLAGWILVSAVNVIRRSRSSPASLLLFYISTLVVHLLLVVDAQNPSEWVAMSAAIGSILVILMMPLRDSSLPSSGISKVGEIPTCQQRSPEDSLRLWEFLSVSWMGPMISIGKSRQLNEEDVWALGFEFQHKRLHESFRQLKGSVIQRLLRANGIDVAIIICTASVETICEFAMPVLLQQLLKAMENPFSPKRIALTYSLLGLMVQGIEAQSEVLTLWYGRRCYERSRGEMTMMVYEKALSRKNVVGQEETEKANDKANEAKDANGTALNGAPMSKTKYHRYCGFFQRFWSKSEKSKPDTKQPASMGKILNLIRGDVYEIAQRFWDIESLVEKPLGLVFGVVLVWILLGPSCFVGIITIVIAQAVNVLITKVLLQWERKRRTASDKRLNVTSTFVEAIRHLRYYSWENHWLKQIMEARQHELYMRVVTTLFRTVITLVNSLASGLFPVAALYAYTFLYGHRLSIDVIFPALQLFGKLESSLREIPGLITTLLNAYISVGRIEDFMNEDNKESKAADPSVDPSSLELIDCTFAWPGAIGTIPPVLHNINLSFRPGFNVICGKVGAGKSALLQALLGELDTIQGEVKMPDEMIGYCAQSPWLQSMSIRDNILFSSPFNEDRYSQVLECCELLPDLAEFKHGDLSFIGENGIGLSGGQKARVALARAVYSRSNILILDDPLSALDFQTGETIVRKCFKGPLMEKKTIILVTHRTDLVSHLANQVIAITDGSATVLNSDVLSENGFANGIDSKVPNSTEEEINANGNSGISTPDKFMDEEHRAEWGVQARVYWKYIKSGGLNWWALLIVALACHRSLSIAQSWFLKSWGEGYNEESQSFILIDRAGDMFSSKSFSSTQNFSVSKLSWHNPITDFPSPADDVRPWLVAFLVIAILQSVMLLTVSLVQLAIMYCAGKTLFAEAMLAVSRATFRFYDVTPVGRLMNRLTSDIGTIDGNIANSFMGIANNSITWCASVFIIATVTPAFLVFAFLISGIFVWIFFQFLPTSQSLRRLEMVSLSPLMSNFGELLHGLTTVRAFQAEHNFQDRVIATVDKFQGMDHFYWSTQNWLMFRYDFLAASSSFALKVLALYTNVSPGLTAFVLIAAGNYVSATRFLCRRYGQLQMDFVSVERVDELLHVDQEETGSVDPPASWPIFGSEIIFEDVTIRYAPNLDPSLTNISLHIPGGSTTAIVGRTGSGKSTLAISLLAVVRPESGRILIDNIDLATVSTKALRERITFVAQDPVLFSGTIRLNLDPTSSYTDAECTTALERICHRYAWTLETPIEAGGRNLSQGQRQLIGLTRAVLRRSPVVILDEATASIDSESSMEIQQVLREEMGAATVLMIAHRVEAVKGANFAVVLDKGRVVRAGPAGEVGEGIVREALGRV
ncbi:ABC transporter [Venturia nashicola]|nr:ABC transporter [Venturia nashicola]